MLKILTSVSFVFLANAAFADCATVINNYRVDLVKSGIVPVGTHTGGRSVGDAFRIVDEMKEMELIADARTGRDSQLVSKFELLVNQKLSQFESNKTISRPELIAAISDASSKNLICNEFYGAMSLSQVASIIAAKVSQQ